MSTKATFAVMMALCAASACDDSSAPVLGRRVIAVDGSGQVGTVGALVSLPYQVLVTEAPGMVLPGHPVSWTVLSGGGSMHAADAATNANGYASATHRLGTTAGIHTVRVTASGAETPVWFHTIAEPAAPATVTKFSGDEQTGAPGQALAAPYRVRVTDQYGNPNVGVRVEWVALRGSLSTATEEYTSTEGVARAWHVLSNEAGVPDSVLAVVDSAGARDTIVFVSHATSTLQILTQVPVPSNYGLHDTFVRDGIAFACVWNSGVFIYDVGNGIAGGTPAAPVAIDTIHTQGGEAHNAWWFHNPVTMERRYLFVGEEGPGVIGASSSGDIHVIDVSDLHNPQEVAFYRLTGAGPHNFWMDEAAQVLYSAYYNGGVVALDVSGTLAGDLRAAGREIARTQPGGAGNTFTWGVQQHQGSLYAVDMLSGLWQLRHTGTTLSVAGGGNNVADRYGSDLWAHGDYVYTGTWGVRSGNLGNTVKVWHLDAAGAPTLVDSLTIANLGTVSDIQVSSDGKLLVFSGEAGAGAGLYVYSLADPAHPVPVARANGLSVHTATVADIGARRYVFAAKNPSEPAMVVFDITDFVP